MILTMHHFHLKFVHKSINIRQMELNSTSMLSIITLANPLTTAHAF
jgi:hypothetical protein